MKILNIILSLFVYSSTVFAQGFVFGNISEATTTEKLPAVNLVFYQNDAFALGVITDLDGFYQVELKPGTYTLKASYIGYQDYIKEIVVSEIETEINFKLKIGIDLPMVVVTGSGRTLTESIIKCYGTSRNCFQNIEPEEKENKAKNQEIKRAPIAKVYPNPAAEFVILETDRLLDAIKIISTDGKILYYLENPQSTKLNISLPDWPAGIYFVQFFYEDQMKVERLMVRNSKKNQTTYSQN